MNKTVTAEQMINYLQKKLTKFKKMEKRLGWNNEQNAEFLEDMLDELIAQKELVEALIEEPVNLGVDGKVTVGF